MQINKSAKPREEYIFIDIFRVVCALMVFSGHMPPFADYSDEVTFWLEQIVCRTAVPFFFITSGYFLTNKVKDWQKIKGYFMKLLRLYVVYTVLYIPQIIYDFKKTGEGMSAFMLTFLRDFFLYGSYTHLWYFLAMMVVVLMIYFFKNKTGFSDGTILAMGFVMYLIGCAGCTYRSITVQNEFWRAVVTGYEQIFVTTRNGVFFGFFFVFLGYCIRLYGNRIQEKYYPVLAVLFFGLMHAESYMLRFVFHIEDGLDMSFSLPFAAAFIFLVISSIRMPMRYAGLGKYMRKLSVPMFGLHLFVRFYLHWILLHVLGTELGSLPYYLVMTAAVTGISALIIWLEDKKGFGFLKFLS